MSEFNAALGLLQLQGFDESLAKRKAIDARYRSALAGVKGIKPAQMTGETVSNYAYFPILVQPDYPLSRDALFQKFRDNGINVRRYFYPLISDFSMYRGLASAAPTNLPVARQIAQQVICLPIYPGLRPDQVDRILGLI
jgi:dTDP-4-amino-4,6-dideoxygalactose transaminase